jgi:RNA 2',3'-cyclic 3'-phosphodiesterase
MRAFMAVEVSTELVDEIVEIQKTLAEANALVKFVEPENLHFTFKFLGDITPEKALSITSMAEEKVKNYSPFDITIKGTGVFPNLGYIRVIWLGIKEPDTFSRMQEDFDQEFVKMGFNKERSYIPHLTIGRVKGVQNKELLVSVVKELENIEIGTMKVDRLVLKESDLTPVGPIYTDLKEIYL